MAGERWRLGHRPGLDGLRGVAIGLVFVGHLFAVDSAGRALSVVGVTLFFTLSGFLITALLVGERADTGRVAWPRFYRRRAARLLPALVVMLAVVGTLQTVTGLTSWSISAAVLGYVANWPLANGADYWLLVHTWSLGVEEQFYLVWPVVLLVSFRWRRGPLVVASVGLVASALWRLIAWISGAGMARVYFGADMHLDALLVGCLLALLCHYGVRLTVPRPVLAVLATGFAVAAIVSYSPTARAVWIPTVVPWLTFGGIVVACSSTGWLTSPVLRYLGRRSYGLYLWHYPLAGIAGDRFDIIPMWLAIGLAFVIAETSWRLVERPFLRRGSVAVGSSQRAVLLRTWRRPDAARPDAAMVLARP